MIAVHCHHTQSDRQFGARHLDDTRWLGLTDDGSDIAIFFAPGERGDADIRRLIAELQKLLPEPRPEPEQPATVVECVPTGTITGQE